MPGGFGDDPADGGRYQYQGQVDPNAPSVSNGQISMDQWAEYQKKRKRDAIWGILATVGGMLGAQPLANAVGIGSGASGALGSGSVPGAVGAAEAPLGVGSVSAGAGALPATATATSLAPYARTVAQNAPRAAGEMALGGGGMSARDMAALVTSLAGTTGAALSNPPNQQINTATTDPNMQKLIATMQGRLDQSEPLYKSIMSMANGLLPTQYQKGGGGMG